MPTTYFDRTPARGTSPRARSRSPRTTEEHEGYPYAVTGIPSAVAGDGAELPSGSRGASRGTLGRGVVLTALAALAGFGIAGLVGNTGVALGAGSVQFAVVETAIRAVRPTWQPWLRTDDAVALLDPGGLPPVIEDGPPDATDVVWSTEHLVANLQGGLVLGGVTIAVVGVVILARRDLS